LRSSKTDANSHVTSYGYNANGDLTSVSTPNSRVTQFGTNALGTRTSRTDALSRTTGYTVDAWQRVTTTDYPTGTDSTFVYDANGNVTSFTDATGTTSRVYDDANRPTSESKGGVTQAAYAYDATGKKGLLSTLTDANGRVLTYAYTVRNQLASVSETAGTTSYGYDNAGNETGVTNANGTTVTKVYDNAGRLSSLTNKTSGGSTLSSFAYGYTVDNQRNSVTEASGAVVSYGYDGAGRLVSEGRTGANSFSATYTLDGEGNRTSQTIGSATTAFTYSADDELTSTSSTSGGFVNSYAYNANGEQTSRTLAGTTYTLAYDYDGQLASIGGAGSASFAYDAAERRTSRTAGGVTTAFVFAGSQVLLEKQGTSTTRTYTYGNALVRMNTEYPLFDGLGSERTVTDSSQTVTGTLTSEAFGQTVATTGSSANPYMFAATSGYRNDGDAGLSHVGARYYDAQVGRFITRDTYLDQKPYLYCEHDPVNATDPSGHYLIPILAGAMILYGAYQFFKKASDMMDEGRRNNEAIHNYAYRGNNAALGAALNERRDLINRTNQMAQEQAADRYIYGPLGDGLGNGRREFFDLGVETVNQLNEAL
jgi:RHS repeat-associated protein